MNKWNNYRKREKNLNKTRRNEKNKRNNKKEQKIERTKGRKNKRKKEQKKREQMKRRALESKQNCCTQSVHRSTAICRYIKQKRANKSTSQKLASQLQ